MDALPPAAWVSLVLTALVLVGWMLWGLREYRRTGRATWLWLGVLMAASLLVGLTRLVR